MLTQVAPQANGENYDKYRIITHFRKIGSKQEILKTTDALKWDAAEDTSRTQHVSNNANNNMVCMRTGVLL